MEALLKGEPNLLHHTTIYDRQCALHIAAANGQIEILAVLLEKSVNPNVVNRRKQTPLMLVAMHGKISCVNKLIESGANILCLIPFMEELACTMQPIMVTLIAFKPSSLLLNLALLLFHGGGLFFLSRLFDFFPYSILINLGL